MLHAHDRIDRIGRANGRPGASARSASQSLNCGDRWQTSASVFSVTFPQLCTRVCVLFAYYALTLKCDTPFPRIR